MQNIGRTERQGAAASSGRPRVAPADRVPAGPPLRYASGTSAMASISTRNSGAASREIATVVDGMVRGK